MHNFLRILRSSSRHRWTIIGIFASSTMVAFLWGANIGALFPIIKVAIKGESLQFWLKNATADSQTKIDDLQRELATLEVELAAIGDERGRRENRSRQSTAQHDLKAERRALRPLRERLRAFRGCRCIVRQCPGRLLHPSHRSPELGGTMSSKHPLIIGNQDGYPVAEFQVGHPCSGHRFVVFPQEELENAAPQEIESLARNIIERFEERTQ